MKALEVELITEASHLLQGPLGKDLMAFRIGLTTCPDHQMLAYAIWATSIPPESTYKDLQIKVKQINNN